MWTYSDSFYLDANELYGLTMSQCLPTSEPKWLTDEEICDFHVSIRCKNYQIIDTFQKVF